MSTERIQIIVSERGSRTVRRNIRGIGDDAQRSHGAVTLLNRAMRLLGGGLAVREIARLSDAATILQNKIKIAESSVGRIDGAFERLVGISNEARVSVDDLGQVFLRASIASKELGASQEDLFNFVDTVAKGLATQGSAANEARGALTQLGQSLGSGIVRAEEFNSILEGAFPIAQAAANGIDAAGGSVAKLRQLVVAGAITSDEFFRGILSQQDAIAEVFAKTNPTIGQSFQVLRNNFIQLIKDFNEGTGAAGIIAKAILGVATSLDLIVRAAALAGAALALAFARRKALLVTSYVQQVIALELALGATSVRAAAFGGVLKTVSSVFRGFLKLLGATPLGRLINLLILAGTALFTFKDKLGGVGKAFQRFLDIGQATFQIIGEKAAAFGSFISDKIGPVISSIGGFFADLVGPIAEVWSATVSFLKNAVNKKIGIVVGFVKAAGLIFKQGLPAGLKAAGALAVNGLVAIVEKGLNAITGGIKGFLGGIDALTGGSLASKIGNVDLSGFKIQVGGAAGEVAAEVAGAFSDALGADYIGSVVDPILKRADQIDADRNAKNFDSEEADPTTTINSVGDAATGNLKKVKEAADEVENTFKGGLKAAFEQLAGQTEKLGENVRDFVVGAFDSLSDSIVEFAKTGKFNIREFFSDLFAQLLKLATNQLFAQLFKGGGLSSLFGGGGGGIGGLLGFKTGGEAMVAGQGGPDSQLVAFKATPGERVSIETPSQQSKSDAPAQVVQQAPQTNVAVVISPADIAGALGGSEGDTAIVRGIERNARAIRSVLGA